MRGSYSKISTFTSCRRSYYYSYILKIEPRISPDYFIIGAAAGDALQKLYGGELKGDFRAQLLADIEARAAKHFLTTKEVARLAKLKATISGMIGGYFAHYGEEIKKTKLLAKELKIEFPIGKHVVAGRLDMLLEVAGKRIVDEDKTCSNIDQFIQDMEMSLQVPIYLLGLEHAGIKFDEARYNLIKKPTIRLKKKETVEEFAKRCTTVYFEDPVKYFHRQPLRIEDHLLEKAKVEIEQTLDEMELLHEGKLSREVRNRRNCSKGSQCAFRLLCLEGESPETMQFYQKRVWR